MPPKAKPGRIAVPAFYSLVGFGLSIGLQATCHFVDRKLVLQYPLTRRPTAVPTSFPTPFPSPSPSSLFETDGPTMLDVPTSLAPTVSTPGVPTTEGGPEQTAVPTSLSPTASGATAQPPVEESTTNAPTVSQAVEPATDAPTPQQQTIEGAGADETGGGRARSLQSEETAPGPTAAAAPKSPTSAPTSAAPEEVDEFIAQLTHSVGLWEWEVSGQCFPYSICIATAVCFSPNFDSAFNTARTFGILASLLGGVATLIIIAAMIFPFDVAYLTPVYTLLMIFQGLSLMVFSSDICHRVGDVEFWYSPGRDASEMSAQEQEFTNYVTDNTDIDCSHEAGSKMAISALVMWFLAAITCFWNVKRTRDV